MAPRTASLKVNLTPEMLERIKASAEELGVTPAAWASMRLGEAVRAQDRITTAMDALGANLASVLAGGNEGEGD